METKASHWLVTGGGRGLGRAVAIAAARDGGEAVVVARTKAELEEVTETIRRGGGVAHAIAADIADKERTHAIAGEAAALMGSIDVLVHAAATLGPVPLEPVLETPCEDLERALMVNVVGPHRLTKAIVPSMLLRGIGVIVHVSSDAAIVAYPEWGAYGASKAAFELMARTMAAEVASSGVRSLIVDPGEMDTQMHEDALPHADRTLLARPADVAEKILAIVRDGRLGPNGARVVLSHVESW